jgi:hypothetical protein
MMNEPQYMVVTTPFLFGTFVECRTKRQRQGVRTRLKDAAKRAFSWKGSRKR